MITQKEILTINLEKHTKLNLDSFQATFYEGKNNTLYKVYGTENVWGLIPFNDPDQREAIIDREVLYLQNIAPQLKAKKIKVVIDGITTSAIQMAIIKKESFLRSMLDSGKHIPKQTWVKIAKQMTKFQKKAELCPYEETPYNEFLTKLLSQEISLLISHFPKNQKTYKKWGATISTALTNNENVLGVYNDVFQEPVIGHGDAKIDNIAIIGNGINIIDPAPIKQWQTNCRRMDAHFLYTDLLLSGKEKEGKLYWTAYKKEWNKLVAKKRKDSGLKKQQLEIVIQTVDKFIELYRLLIFYRLSLNTLSTKPDNKVAEQRNKLCKTKIEAVLKKMK